MGRQLQADVGMSALSGPQGRESDTPSAAERVSGGLVGLLTKLLEEDSQQRSLDCSEFLSAALRLRTVVSTNEECPAAVIGRPLWFGGDVQSAGSETHPASPGRPRLAAEPRELAESLVAHIEGLIRGGELGYVLYRGARGAWGYSYVLHLVKVSVRRFTDLGRDREISFDKAAPLGKRRTYAGEVELQGEASLLREEHVHHLRGAKAAALSKWKGRAPWRVGELLKVVPDWIRPHLQLIEGKIIEEEIHTTELRTGTVMLTKRRVWKDSPALVLGDLVLAGWSSDDLAADPPETMKADKWTTGRRVIGFVGTALGMLGLGYLLLRAFRG